MVHLQSITEDNYKECIALRVSDNQTKFVSSNVHSLAKAYVFRDRVTTFAIYNDDVMIGFMMLRFNYEYRNYFIWQFMIDERYQGRGYGKQALKLAIDWMKNDQRCKQIVTTYIEGNESVRCLYEQLGFKPMSEAIDGEVDMVLDF